MTETDSHRHKTMRNGQKSLPSWSVHPTGGCRGKAINYVECWMVQNATEGEQERGQGVLWRGCYSLKCQPGTASLRKGHPSRAPREADVINGRAFQAGNSKYQVLSMP